MKPLELVLVNSGRIGPLGCVIRVSDGFIMDFNQFGVVIQDARRVLAWLVPWANIASIRVDFPDQMVMPTMPPVVAEPIVIQPPPIDTKRAKRAKR